MSKPHASLKKRATNLAEWTIERMANRLDACGGYYRKAGKTEPTTRKKIDLSELLTKHFAATKTGDIVGLHSTCPKSNTSKWLAFDIDAHSDKDDPQANWKAVTQIVERLDTKGFAAHVFDSNGAGGFHVFTFFENPQPTDRVHAFGTAIIKGLPIVVETFPKQPSIAPNAFGNWIRVPGRHHTRDHWAKVWTGQGWVELTSSYLLAIEGDDTELPDAAVSTRAARPEGDDDYYEADASEVAIVIDRLKRIPPAVQGQKGHDQTYKACCMAVRDHGLSVDQALIAMGDWNKMCDPPWLRDKLVEILTHAKQYGQNPVGSEAADRSFGQWNIIGEANEGDDKSTARPEIHFANPTGAGTATINVRLGDRLVYSERKPISGDKHRQEVAKQIAEAAGCRVDDVCDELLSIAAEIAEHADDADSESSRKDGQATQIVNLVRDGDTEFFHDADGVAFAKIAVNDHFEIHRIGGRAFRRWLSRIYYEKSGAAPNAAAILDAVGVLEGFAIHEGKEHKVHLRSAEHDGKFYFDIGDDDWRVICVTANGYRVIASEACPVYFRRTSGMLPLPVPEEGGSLEGLRRFVNIGDDDQFVLLLAWIVAAMRPSGPYPVLSLNGEHGSAKSTTCRAARALVDPSTSSLRRPPKDERDLMIAASNTKIVAYDNLSGLSATLSDGLCVLATGGGFATRRLHTDDEEAVFNVARPIMINGIEDVATRPDLLDRCVNLRLPVIAESERRDEATLWGEFNAALPKMFGALLDAVSAGMKNVGAVKLHRLPRMADFAIWATAAEPALGVEPGAFMRAYTENRSEANDAAIESSVIGPALVAMMEDRESWAGTASQLLSILADDRYSKEKDRVSRSWPKNGRMVRAALDRIAPNLRLTGIVIEAGRREGHNRNRIIEITQQNNPEQPSATSAWSTQAEKPHYEPIRGDSAADSLRTVCGRSADGLRTIQGGDRPHEIGTNGDCGLETHVADVADDLSRCSIAVPEVVLKPDDRQHGESPYQHAVRMRREGPARPGETRKESA